MYNKMRKINKKAISPVITTILLILISIAAVAFVYSIVIPFIKDQLRKGGDCFKAQDQIFIDTASKYTCWTTDDDGTGDILVSINVKRNSEPLGITQFVATVSGEGKSERFDIIDGFGEDVRIFMYDGHKSGTTDITDELIAVPMLGEKKTYILKTTMKEVTSVNLAPIMGGTTCDAMDEKYLEDSRCDDADIFS